MRRNILLTLVMSASIFSFNNFVSSHAQEQPGDVEAVAVNFQYNGIRAARTIAGNSGKIYVEARNNGESRVSGIGISVIDNGRTVIERTVDIQPRETYREYFDYTPVEAGQHSLEFIVDSRMSLTESNENNNRVTGNFEAAAAQTEIRPTTFGVFRAGTSGTQHNVELNEQVQIMATVTNSGNVGPGIVPFRIEMDGQPVMNDVFPAVEPGQFANRQTMYAFPTAGQHTLRLIVDPDNRTIDSDRSNNISESAVNVTGGDLRPTTLAVTLQGRPGVDTVDMGDNNTGIHIAIFNGGRGRVNMVPYRVELDGRTIADSAVRAIEPNAYGSDDIPYKFMTAGQQTLRLIVDPNNQCPETDEQNNTLETAVNVAVTDYEITGLRFRSTSGTPAGGDVLGGPSLTSGNAGTLSITVKNNGTCRLTCPVSYTFSRNGTYNNFALGGQMIDPGQERTIETPPFSFYEAGEYTASAMLDINNVLTETNENNNIRSITVRAVAPAAQQASQPSAQHPQVPAGALNKIAPPKKALRR